MGSTLTIPVMAVFTSSVLRFRSTTVSEAGGSMGPRGLLRLAILRKGGGGALPLTQP